MWNFLEFIPPTWKANSFVSNFCNRAQNCNNPSRINIKLFYILPFSISPTYQNRAINPVIPKPVCVLRQDCNQPFEMVQKRFFRSHDVSFAGKQISPKHSASAKNKPAKAAAAAASANLFFWPVVLSGNGNPSNGPTLDGQTNWSSFSSIARDRTRIRPHFVAPQHDGQSFCGRGRAEKNIAGGTVASVQLGKKGKKGVMW